MRLVFVAIVLAFVFGLACVPSEPSPNADPALTSPRSKAITTYPQLNVRVYPGGSADVLLNPVPLDGGLFPSGMIVTIDVLLGPGWEIDEDGWKGPVFDIAGDTAKIKMISTQEIVIKMRPAVRPQAGRPAPKPQASGATSKPEAGRPAPKPQAGRPAPKPEAGRPAPKPQAGRPAPKPQASGKTSIDQLYYLTLNTIANPIVGGTVTGGGRYPSGEAVQVVATPNPGYTLRGWTTPRGTRCASAGFMMCTIIMVGDLWVTADFRRTNEDDEDDGLLDWHLERYGETGNVEVSETGSQYKIKLKLWSRPSSDAVLSIVSDDTGEVAVSPATLTFTGSNWNRLQTVTLTGVDDTDRDGNQTTIVKVSGVGDGWTSLRGEALYVVTEDDDGALKSWRLLGQGTGNAPTGTPPPTVSTCLSIESYSGTIDDSGTFVQTIGQLPIRRGETISVSGTYYYDGTWKVLQYFRYNDLWGYRIEKKWQGFPDDKDPMVCTLP